METFNLYILQVNIALLVFYLLYRLLFSRDTFLEIRRIFLFSAVFLSFFHPLFSLLISWQQELPLQAVMLSYAEVLTVTASRVTPVEAVFTWQHLAMLIWITGSVLLLVRMAIQFIVVCRLAHQGKRKWWGDQSVIALEEETAPFSFFGWIFVNPDHYEEKDLCEIMTHESVHVRQWHSLDMLMTEILCVLFWFNPAVWLLRNEIRQNLEFLADRNVVRSGYNRKNYQYHLLRLSHHSTIIPIVNHFNVSLLKKRIMMMNKKKTSRMSLVKYALLLPVTGLLILAGNATSWAGRFTEEATVIAAGLQATDVEGTVVDENGQPLAGVTVVIKGTHIGTVTDKEGHFALKDCEGATLCFSYIGMATQEVKCGKNQNRLKIVMKTEAQVMDDFVVNQPTPEQPKTKQEGGEIFVVVEEMPVFQGNLQEYLAKNVKYPESAVKRKVEGKVFVSFVVDKDGKVIEPQVVRQVDPELDEEALRVVTQMPFWKPGKQRGKVVRVKYVLPIQFSLNGAKQAADETASGKTIMRQNVVYIVNGKRMSDDFNNLPVDTIQSISIVKDKTTMEKYGAEGKEGVIIIKTK